MTSSLKCIKDAQVTFRVKVDTSFGDDVYVVGSDVELGAWKPKMAARLRTHEEAYPVPCGFMNVNRSLIEFK